MATIPGTEQVRFRRPTTGPNAVKPKEIKKDEFGSMAPQGWKRRHQGILQDLVGRQSAGPMVPSFSVAVRILLLIRAAGAMYNIISDCDEVFNFFEPLHYFQHNEGFQTWELSPQFAIRSWSYVLLHYPLAAAIPRLLSLGKRQQFFALRMILGFISTVCEAKFYRAVVEAVNERVGRYMLFSMIFSAGMSSASVAFLPSSFTMYTTLLANSFWFHPATSTPTGTARAYKATILFALGAIVGWPFSAALAIPFVIEQLFTTGGEIATGQEKQSLTIKRWDTMLRAIAIGASISIPVYLIDSWVYGRNTFPTLNILWYNLLSPLGGPELYGTSPATYYLQNLFLNFNFLLPMALVSLPALAITYVFDYKRLGKSQQKPVPGQTSPYTLLIARMAPFYIWLGILSAQAHKEERFFFPAYPLLCFNAAVTVFLAKGWFEAVYIKVTKSPWLASKTPMFSNFTLACIMIPAFISIFRIVAIFKFYHAPLDIAYHFQYTTIPHILTSLGHGPKPPPKNYKPYTADEVIVPEWDYTPLTTLDPPISLCYASEWHRYPGSFMIPEGIDVQWVKTDFDGMMPRRWESSAVSNTTGVWPRPETRVVRDGRFNGMNKASVEPGTFVPVEQCNYLVSLNLPSQPHTDIERDYIHDPSFEKEYCTTFLDGASSKWWARLVWIPWLPQGLLDKGRVYGEYCLLKRK